jgi:hypothetical protein
VAETHDGSVVISEDPRNHDSEEMAFVSLPPVRYCLKADWSVSELP